MKCRCLETTNTIVEDDAIVFKCQPCVNRTCETHRKCRTTLFIVLRRRLGINRDMAKKICQSWKHPFQEFHLRFNDNGSFVSTTASGRCAYIHSKYALCNFKVTRILSQVTHLECIIQMEEMARIAQYIASLLSFTYETCIIHWQSRVRIFRPIIDMLCRCMKFKTLYIIINNAEQIKTKSREYRHLDKTIIIKFKTYFLLVENWKNGRGRIFTPFVAHVWIKRCNSQKLK